MAVVSKKVVDKEKLANVGEVGRGLVYVLLRWCLSKGQAGPLHLRLIGRAESTLRWAKTNTGRGRRNQITGLAVSSLHAWTYVLERGGP